MTHASSPPAAQPSQPRFSSLASYSPSVPAVQPLQLVVTPRMTRAFAACKAKLSPEERVQRPEYQELAAVFRATADAQPQRIKMEQLSALSTLYRSLHPEPRQHAADEDGDDVDAHSGYLHELARGSRPYVTPVVKRPRDPAFLAYLEQQRWKQERREYASMVADLPGNSVRDPEGTMGGGFASASRDIGHGVNILTLMGTGFAVFWYAGTNLFPHNHIYPVLCGLLGLVAALLLEVSLFLVRDQKAELERVQQQRLAVAAKQSSIEAERRRGGPSTKHKELERRAKAMKEMQEKSKDGSPDDGTEGKLD